MNLFYNLNGVGNVLLVQFTSSRPRDIRIESKADVTLIYDDSKNELVGLNLFNASSYMELKEEGQVELTESIALELKQSLVKNGVDVQLDVDFTPKFVIGLVEKTESHPNADKLKVCTVDVGDETLQIVCGASNIAEGQKVVVAKVGAVMASGTVIRDAELRGVASSGMICSATELNIPNAEKGQGILVLEESSVIGEAFIVSN
ncbi:YtpR family tRNA-binding protein [Sporosarcina siberiensis]|uniref:YtpR family tRNA-binding protein n=1 Tax=Sporosarcina siberiensis TaxID=1365606 RepID=A0ABW4SC78_9BACL